MAIHERVLAAALRICRERGKWTFRPREVVDALAGLNRASVRTHLMSRCCVNAPAHHAHRWPYFRRVGRGVYEILPAWRRRRSPAASGAGVTPRDRRAALEKGIVVEVRESGGNYVAEIPGLSAKFRGASLDEVAARARDAARASRAPSSGRPGPVRLRVELEPDRPDPLTEAYEKDIDRTLIRQSLRMSPEERLLALEGWMNDTEEIRGAASRPRRRSAR